MRKVVFTAIDGTVNRTNLFFHGDILKPPKLLQFRGKLYHYVGSSGYGGLDTNHYREVEDSFMIVD
jgi:hypothetical protein